MESVISEKVKRFLSVDPRGSGYGSGSGYGIKSLCGEIFHNVDNVPTIINVVRGNVAKGFTLNGDLTLRACFIVKSGGCFAHGETLHAAQEALDEKLMESMSDEERIDAFLKEFNPTYEYPAKAFYDWHHRLTGSCEFGRNAFARDHGINVETDVMTVHKFIELTKDAYGGRIIRQLAERLSEI